MPNLVPSDRRWNRVTRRYAGRYVQCLIALMGLAVLVFLLWEPQVEGRNAQASLFEIYFHDPFLALVYLASLPFFVALYQAARLVGLLGSGRTNPSLLGPPLRMMKRCGQLLTVSVFCLQWILLGMESDDRAGGVAIGLVVLAGALSLIALAHLFEGLLQDAATDQVTESNPSDA